MMKTALVALALVLSCGAANAQYDPTGTSALIRQLGGPNCAWCAVAAQQAESNARRHAEPQFSVPNGMGGQNIYGGNGSYLGYTTPNGTGGYYYYNR